MRKRFEMYQRSFELPAGERWRCAMTAERSAREPGGAKAAIVSSAGKDWNPNSLAKRGRCRR